MTENDVEKEKTPFVYKPEKVAEMLDINVQTVLRYIREGKLGASKLGRVYRITPDDLSEFLHSTNTKRKKGP